MLSVFDKGPFLPCPVPFNMAAHVLRRAEDCAEKVALSVIGGGSETSMTYGELTSAVLGLAQGFLEQGLNPGDLIVLRLGNTADYPIAHLAAIAAGMVSVPTSSQLTDPEVNKIYADLDPALVLHCEGVALGNPPCPVLTETDLVSLKKRPPAQFHMGDANRPAYIVYTSGTSGQPRAVMHAHRAIWARQMMIRDWYDLKSTDRLLHAGAFNWTFTMGTGLLDPWSVGATSLILAPGTDLADLPDILRQHRATLFAAAPGVFRKLLQTEGALTLPDLRHALSAGEKLPARQREQWQRRTGTNIYEAFGMSECSTFISQAPHVASDPASLGHPQTGRKVAIVTSGGPVPLGDIGQIAVHRDDPGLMLGYVNAPAETEARFKGDWFLTGDLGCMAKNGCIHYQGRADDMMNAGGFRVSPVEVEQALSTMPGLHQIAVTEVEIKADTHVIAAFFIADDSVTIESIEAFAKSVLARYKQPRLFIKVSSLPTNPNGKLNRKRLRAAYEASSNGSD
ncbi:class I adenylate-forming enzyme family protein [Cognatishimia maritima]|uniref:Acyl-CoA synthetase (AMP-forming)/AMP-acid ligase II n=1 Tax=Cognatishimia maritima TaxID=870908 RepID=A0A1M5IAJ2_9RHOB|nr:class I adenylate-forming enzyme family protein [Cognatishimia maritima]SHG25245.1 Acyl-CoA synthetase (AMP-forming)/AMP-acid ligase II [Cognatishimia maritima]